MSVSSILLRTSLRCLLAALASVGLVAATRAATPDVAELAAQLSELRTEVVRLGPENVALRQQFGGAAPATTAAASSAAGFRYDNIPVRLAGTFMLSPGAGLANRPDDAGISVRQAASKGTCELSYRYPYRVLEADAWHEELAHPDFGGFHQSAPAGGAAGYHGGTNVADHVFRGTYALNDHVPLGFTSFMTHLLRPSPSGSPSATRRLQVDTHLKF